MQLGQKKLCELCDREVSRTTVHHLVPQTEGGRKKSTVELCISCHRQIHALYTNRQLGLRLNTLEKLKNDEKILRYLKWIKNQDNDIVINVRRSRDIRMRKQ